MYCVSPIQLKDTGRSYKRPPLVPCGKCLPCLEKRRNDWSIRLKEQHRVSDYADFITLTYNDESIVYGETHPTLVKSHLQDFFNELRNQIKLTYRLDGKFLKSAEIGIKLKYYAVGEYGSKFGRPHYHIILFGLPIEHQGLVAKSWNKGFVHFGDCNIATIHYVSGYIINAYDEDYQDRQKPFALMSKGLGKTYAEKMGSFHLERKEALYTQLGGVKYALPRYLKDKIFSDQEKNSINRKNVSYAQRRQENLDNKLRSEVKTDAEYYATKHARTTQHLENRSRYFTKGKKL